MDRFGDDETASIQAQMRLSRAEYLRPWKLFSLACGIGLLVLGSVYFPAPDWDIAISLIMALFTYLTAPFSLRVIVERRWRLWPAMLFATWFSVDGCYWLYWRFKNPVALDLMRDANFFASLSLYGICGLVWFFRGSLRELIAQIGARRRPEAGETGAAASSVAEGRMRDDRMTRVRAVLAGYALAVLVALIAVNVRLDRTQGPDAQASAGMYAFGDALMFLTAFAVIAMFPTVVALGFLRPNRTYWTALAAAAAAALALCAYAVLR